jgi:hypothetical protein
VTAGVAIASLAGLIRGAGGRVRAGRRVVAAAVAVVVLAVAGIEARELAPAGAPASPAAVTTLVPPGSCLIADQVSFAIAAGRLAPPQAGCPDVIDSLATTLALSGGVSPAGGAGQSATVIAGWETIFSQADFVWLQGGFKGRIPWTPALQAWFSAHFHQAAAFPGYGASTLYARDR